MHKSGKIYLLLTLTVGHGLWAAASTDTNTQPNASISSAGEPKPASGKLEFFERKVRPILADNCYDCHSADTKSSGGLRLDDHDAILKGGDTGPAIIPGDPEQSLLVQRLHLANPKRRMPKNSDPLTDDEITTLTTWIKDGAAWSDQNLPSPVARAGKSRIADSALSAAAASMPAGGQVEFFEKKIRPIFVSHCYNCHSADTKPAGGLRVDDLDGLLTGGDDGPGIVPGKPDDSLVIQRVLSDNPKRRMPKEGALLTEAEVADLTVWIKGGAAWPREVIPPNLGKIRADYVALRTNHWAWQPLTQPPVPVATNDSWSHDNIDRFILAKLKTRDLLPVPDADRTTLIRRVTYDLTGLPPTPEEVDAFLKDKSTNAFPDLVDRLLASPRFGERWGRHWLDVARYAESTGPSRNVPYPFAWKYRDYVIDSVNRDIPFNRFIQEQIAGDLLPAATPAERDRLDTATGFLALGVKDVNQRFKNRFIMDNVDEQIDVVSRSTLALTVSCARCHDHKFDPIPTTDYYALAGVFTSTEDCAGVRNKMGGGGLDYYDPTNLVKLTDYVPTEAPQEESKKLQAEVAAAKKDWDDIRGTPQGLAMTNGVPYQRSFRQKYEKLQGQLLALTDPVTQGHAVHGVREAKTIGDTDVRIRGEAERRGPTVPRGFLTTFAVPDVPAIKTNESGRLELAQWLTSPKNPLVARVFVNRIWEHLFGQGIVTTVDNFGVMGDHPSHPELLDYLANAFIRDGWSTKQLIRTIVLSHAYQLGSESSVAYENIDPDNHLIWRHSPRRLEAEEIRDAILVTAGDLQLKPPATSSINSFQMVEIRDNGTESKQINEAADGAFYRSIYLPLLRGVTPSALAAFDPVDQTLVSGQRESTTVPTQALFMLNSSFVGRESLALAGRLLAEKDASDTERIRQTYRLIVDRAPDSREISRAKKFIAQYESACPKIAPVELAAVQAVAMTDTNSKTDGKVPPVVPVNPDDIDTSDVPVVEGAVQPKTPQQAAWMSFARSLYASAEFRFVR
jgi:mono/diheme cytochrome c family protein